jgi:RNA polymerase sigma-B factor
MTPRPPEQKVELLFSQLRATGDVDVRTALVEHHLPLARSLASRYSYTPQPLDDLVQVASLGLVKAVDAFDPDRGVAFTSFAVPTIVGELKRHMRDTTWAVHVPRALKERVLVVERAERTLSARTGVAPTVQDLAAEADLTAEQVLEALTVRHAHDAAPLDEGPTIGAAPSRGAVPAGASVDAALGAVEDRLSLANALQRVRPRERTILRLRFVDGLTQTEIAERVGLSQMYVSRLLRATLDLLRAEID